MDGEFPVRPLNDAEEEDPDENLEGYGRTTVDGRGCRIPAFQRIPQRE